MKRGVTRMPLQNRVTPWGEIVASPERGLFMGNRGCLHDRQRQVKKAWQRLPWVTCVLEFRDRHREVMTPGQYTELFFLDEATALAAGHRPCARCRRGDYDAFKVRWMEANPELAARSAGKITEIDKLLHAERLDIHRNKQTWSASVGDLPDGAMVVKPGGRTPLLVRADALYVWTSAGYERRESLAPDTAVEVLTPASVVKTLTHGYRPVVHPSAATSPG